MSNKSTNEEILYHDLLASLPLPKGFLLRPLQRTDYQKGLTKTLGELSKVGSLSQEEFNSIFSNLQQTQILLVIEDIENGIIAASGTLLLEQKFIHRGGTLWH